MKKIGTTNSKTRERKKDKEKKEKRKICTEEMGCAGTVEPYREREQALTVAFLFVVIRNVSCEATVTLNLQLEPRSLDFNQ